MKSFELCNNVNKLFGTYMPIILSKELRCRNLKTAFRIYTCYVTIIF